MSWPPPARFRYVTVPDDVVPPEQFGALVNRLLRWFVIPGEDL
jgi:hypothetical protein